MKRSNLVSALIVSFASVTLLTACPEVKKDDSSTDGTGGGGGGGTVTYTCTSPSAGFQPANNGGFVTGLTPGSTISQISFYFSENTAARLGTSTFRLTTTSCTFGGATLEYVDSSVTTTQAYNFVKKTITFSTPVVVPDCGSGVGTVGFLFSNVSSPSSSNTFYAGAQKTAQSSCKVTVATGTSGTPTAHTGLYSFTSEYQ